MKFCDNCGKVFRTGMFEWEQRIVKNKSAPREEKELCLLYDNVCPRCGALAVSFLDWIEFKLSRIKHRIRGH